MGESSELVTLQSFDHYETLVGGLWKSFTNQQESDLDLQWGGLSVRAHRLIVQIFLKPEVLSQSFQDADHQADGTNVISLLEFMYNGRVTVPVKQLPALRDFAQELDFQMLVDVLDGHVRDSGDKGTRSRGSSSHPTPAKSVAIGGSISRRKRKGKPIKLPRSDEKRSNTDYDVVQENETPADSKLSTISKHSKQLRPRVAKTGIENEVGLSSGEEDGDVDSDFRLDQSEPEDSVSIGDKRVESGGVAKKRRRRKAADGPPKKGGRQKVAQRCEHCEYETARLGDLMIHQAKHDPSITVYSCPSCARQFLRAEALDSHVCNNSTEQPFYECHLCDFTCMLKILYINHQAKHDPDVKLFKCSDCTCRYYTEDKLDEHVQSKHAKSYSCTLCDFVTPKSWSLSHHMFSRHEVNLKGEKLDVLRCPQCSFTCKTESKLRYHIEGKHFGIRNFKCDQCSYTSSVKGELTRHVKSIHLNIKPHNCSVCSFATSRIYAYKEHMRRHTSQNPYICHICAKPFINKWSLTFHVRCHNSDVKKHICEVCGHSFNKKHNLTVHLKNVHKMGAGSAAAIK